MLGSTYGAAWRPATPFYNYVPPPPPNWNPVLRSAVGNWPSTAVGLPPFHRSRRPARLGVTNDGPPPEQLRHMIGVMNDWIQASHLSYRHLLLFQLTIKFVNKLIILARKWKHKQRK